jgi:HEAT repeat protein
VEPLIRAFKDRDVLVRIAAAEALGRIGAPAVEPLNAALEDPDEDARVHAAAALSRIGIAPAVKIEPDGQIGNAPVASAARVDAASS